MHRKMLNIARSVLVLVVVLLTRASALEIYRIGGEDEPRPDQVGVNFHQLHWSDFKDKQSLDEEAFSRGVLQPIQLNPETNIASTSVDRGGGPYVRVSGVASYSITDQSKNMIFRVLTGQA